MSSGGGKRGLPKRTGVTEGFYRSVYSSSESNANTATASNATAEARMAQKVVTALDFNAGPGVAKEAAKSPPVMEEATEMVLGTSLVTNPAESNSALRSPGELGVPDAPAPKTERRVSPQKERFASASRQRSIRVIQSTMTPAAAAAAAASVASISKPEDLHLSEPSMVCSLAYRGMEVVFATAWRANKCSVVGICARTRVAFQTLDVAENCSNAGSIVSLTGDPTTGMVAIALSDGVIQTFFPVEASPGPSSSQSAVVSIFGRFRWINGPVIHCADVFCHGMSKDSYVFQDFRSGKATGQSLDISSSVDYKVLVAHRDQLAVFDVTPTDVAVPVVSVGKSKKDAKITTETPQAALLWTSKMHANIVTARLSGDGQAIVVVLEGEGVGTPDPFGARTFVRDLEDGSSVAAHSAPNTLAKPPIIAEHLRQSSSGSAAVGILYKPGPFLIHSTHVTRVSFRGLGHNTSNVHSDEDEGNDLLLTYCADDCSVRIFSQNSWKRLMHWTTPPNSRADWVRGISAFTLGDLESGKKKKSSGSSSLSRRSSFGSGAGDESSGASGAINSGLLGTRPFSTVAANSTAPCSAAGAWIAELTFRDAYPALRLSRLSYMKRSGDDSQPAHFESVAAILPTGSLIASSVLNMDDMGLSVQGIWPAWNPWLAGPSGTESSGSLSGSAMALLGLPSGAASSGGAFGGSHLGTHSPPSELRLVASHPLGGKIVLMEFPLWGDQDFGAMELGSPLRYLLSLSENVGGTASDEEINALALSQLPICIDHESSRLCARIDPVAKSIALTWRKQGSMYVLPAPHHSSNVGISTTHSIASTLSLDSDASHHSFSSHRSYSEGPEPYIDVTVSPLPLVLPTLRLPRNASSSSNETIVAVKWWPDENFDGPPQLLAVTSSGTIILYEMPPPWSAIEPAMPSYDPFDASAASSVAGGDVGPGFSASRDSSDEDSDGGVEQKEYEAMITPHPDFGIGLRLESQADGMPAIAGSYKKHPLTGGRLPAERTGMIVLGDELLAVNGVSLEGLSFDGIIGTVRQVGADTAAGAPICMRFRSKPSNRRQVGSAFSAGGGAGSKASQGNERRTIEQMLGVSPKQKKKRGTDDDDDGSEDSYVSMLVGAECETQQEFGRIIAIVRAGLPVGDEKSAAKDTQSLLVLLPWHYRSGAPDSQQLRGAALLVSAEGKTLHANRLEIAADGDPEKARCFDLGEIELTDCERHNKNNTPECQEAATIRSVSEVQPGPSCSCLAVCDENGAVTLVFVDIDVEDSASANKKSERQGTDGTPPKSLIAKFRQYRIFQCGSGPSENQRFLVRASSVELLATMPQGERCHDVTVWSACPRPSEKDEKESHIENYIQSTVTISSSSAEDDSAENCIVDFRFVPSGSLDSFPWIVTFSKKSAIVHRRSGGSLHWEAIAELCYSALDSSTHFSLLGAGILPFERLKNRTSLVERCMSPADAYPHLIQALKNIVSASDETSLRSDWHPDSILAYVCTDEEGARAALRRSVHGIFVWLSRWMSLDEGTRPLIDMQFPLAITPLSALKCNVKMDDVEEGNDNAAEHIESASNLMSTLSRAPAAKASKPLSEEEKLLSELQNALKLCQILPSDENKKIKDKEGGQSKEFLLAMGFVSGSDSPNQDGTKREVPPPLKRLHRDEIRLLWAIGELLLKPPKFKDLDTPAQLTVFCTSLLRRIEDDENDDDASAKESSFDSAVSTVKASWNSFFKKQPSENVSQSKWHPAIASAGCMSALVCDCQGSLLEACRVPNAKMDWPTARTLRLPFWLRSDDMLRRIAEEIGQHIYKETRDVMECALFFVAVRNMRTLRNLAATDRSNSGVMFLKFITTHDFRSQRGRKAAEKNAYSLLRKRRYGVAASFFLLAEPPMLRTALEIIATQMEDLDLAFMIARLVDISADASKASGGLGGFSSGRLGLGGMMGGGGGFATGAMAASSQTIPNEVKFKDWIPKLGDDAKNLVVERGLLLSDSDSCLKAVQLMWLGRTDEASWRLSGLSTSAARHKMGIQRDAFVPQHFSGAAQGTSLPTTTNARVIAKSNALINFSSGPLLLKAMKAKTRERWASTLLVSRALSRRGVDIPSLRILLQNTDPSDLNEKEDLNSIDSSEGNLKNGKAQGKPISTSSPIFDSFDVPTRPAKHTSSRPEEPESSIFSSFDAQPTKQTNGQTDSDEHATSSIFDGFDARPPPKKASETSGEPSTSIFDSYDRPPQKQKPTVPPSGSQDAMSSSIFDAFDAPPPKAKPQEVSTQSQTGNMASSIFDSFDVATPRSAPQQVAKQSSQRITSPVTANSSDGATPSIPDGRTSEPVTTSKNKTVANDLPPISSLPTPTLWLEWRDQILAFSVARRFLREIARILARFHGDTVDSPMALFRRHIHPLVPYSAAEILRNHCDGEALLSSVRRSLSSLCEMSKLEESTVLDQSLNLLSCPSQPRRILFAVVLYTITERSDLAEDIIRDASQTQIQICESSAFSNDDLVYNRKTYSHVASQYVRRQAARLSWQLELCLWLHRGGTFPLSTIAVKETIVAVRVGLFVAAWGRCHEYLEKLIRCEPDCEMDYDAGHQLWSSMKIISSSEDRTNKMGVASSGGWEFLVDCSREEATDMLRKRAPGSFIIRPHAEDHGVFTLSFKTNLTPTSESGQNNATSNESDPSPSAEGDATGRPPKTSSARPVKKDEVVQHAIIRLSDSGFRCGSFGPFSSLMKLLEAVSASLPFALLFHEPPTERIIKDQGAQPSPNSLLFRKLALTSHSDTLRWNNTTRPSLIIGDLSDDPKKLDEIDHDGVGKRDVNDKGDFSRRKRFGMFSLLLALSEVRKQLSAVAAAEDEDLAAEDGSKWQNATDAQVSDVPVQSFEEENSLGSISYATEALGVEEQYADGSRILRPFLNWCRLMEVGITLELAPTINKVIQTSAANLVALAASDTAIEVAPTDVGSCIDGGDAVIRQLIQPESGVEFRTLRVGEGGDSAMLVLFSKNEAIDWFVSTDTEKDMKDATERLEMMEKRRVIEQVDLDELTRGNETRYRFIDPWEVEALESKEAETMGASLGREHYFAFSVGRVATSCEFVLRSLGGLHLMGFWSAAKGGICLTKAIASVHPPWERDAGGDLQMTGGVVSEPSSFSNSIRQHLYRNALFRRLKLPQRFLALVQVELLDLKNLTSPGGASSLSVYALLRLKRPGSGAPLSLKARTLDSACTHPTKIGKSSGPNAPASWGSLVRFRFPLPEDVNCDGISFDGDREALFKGPPCVLQVSVYEKKFMKDILLGGADVKLDALAGGGQLEEWVPLRSEKDGIHWFARIRLTLRFELMCLESDEDRLEDRPPSVGLRKIQQLSRMGGAHEDVKGVTKSVSTPDLLSYFESMVY